MALFLLVNKFASVAPDGGQGGVDDEIGHSTSFIPTPTRPMLADIEWD